MDRAELMARTRGMVVFAVTPFTERQGQTVVDEDGVRRNLEFLVQGRMPAVVVCGGVGELWELSQAEHLQVVRAAAAQAAGRILVYAGVYGDAEGSAARARLVEEAGADGLLLFPDDEAVPNPEALLHYYTTVSRAVGIGLMPFRADAWVDVPLLRRLVEIPGVVALKEERENMEEFRQIVLALGDRLAVIGAGDGFAPCYLVLGGAGVACSLSNLVPKLYAEMWGAAQRWDYKRVMEIHTSLAPLAEIRRRNGTSALKAALEMIGLAGGPCRAGQPRLDPADREPLRQALAQLGAL